MTPTTRLSIQRVSRKKEYTVRTWSGVYMGRVILTPENQTWYFLPATSGIVLDKGELYELAEFIAELT